MIKVKILIVDDEVDYCMLMQNYFEERDYDVFMAFNLAEGMRLLEKIEPEIMFLDNHLPDGEGWTKIEGIVNNFPEIRLYLISAYGEKPEMIKKRKNITFWEKPISTTDLDEVF